MAEMEDGIRWANDPSHSQHPLKQLYKNTPFRCDLCRVHGRGLHLRCDRCKFTLHEGCSGLPSTLPAGFFAHRRHPLHLNASRPGFLSSDDCLLCGHSIRGAAFRCADCPGVFLHPFCSRLPQRVPRHALHPAHPLALEEKRASAACDACGEKCRRWRYCCGVCDVHIHIECLAKGVDALKERQPPVEVETAAHIASFFGQIIQPNIQ